MNLNFNDNKTKGVFLLLLPLIILTAVTYYFKLFVMWPPVDIPLHIIGGASVAAIFFFVYNKNIAFSLSSTFGILILWEVFEMAGWRLFPKLINCAYLFCKQDIFFWDGFFDIIFGMAAALIITLAVIKSNKNGELS